MTREQAGAARSPRDERQIGVASLLFGLPDLCPPLSCSPPIQPHAHEQAEEARDEPAKAPPQRRNSLGGNRGPIAKLGFCLARNSTTVMIGMYLLIGVMFYGGEEDWSVLNSMFFTLFTLTTVGYGCPDCPRLVLSGPTRCHI